MRMNCINRIVLSTIAFLALRATAGETAVEKRTSAAPRFTLEEAILTAEDLAAVDSIEMNSAAELIATRSVVANSIVVNSVRVI